MWNDGNFTRAGPWAWNFPALPLPPSLALYHRGCHHGQGYCLTGKHVLVQQAICSHCHFAQLVRKLRQAGDSLSAL